MAEFNNQLTDFLEVLPSTLTSWLQSTRLIRESEVWMKRMPRESGLPHPGDALAAVGLK